MVLSYLILDGYISSDINFDESVLYLDESVGRAKHKQDESNVQ